MNFWSIVGLFFWSFVFIAYLFVLFAIIGDLFRDHQLNGWLKALWIIFLVFVPFLTALVYLIARGNHMAARPAQRRSARASGLGRLRSLDRRLSNRRKIERRPKTCSTLVE